MEKIDGLETKLVALGEKLAKLDLAAEPQSSFTLPTDPVSRSSSEIQDLPSSVTKPVIEVAEAPSVNLLSLLPAAVQRLIEPVSSDSLISAITSALKKLNFGLGWRFYWW